MLARGTLAQSTNCMMLLHPAVLPKNANECYQQLRCFLLYALFLDQGDTL